MPTLKLKIASLACVLALGTTIAFSHSLFAAFEATQANSTAASTDLRTLYLGPPESWPQADWDPNVPVEDRHDLAVVPNVVFPDDNPYSKEKAELGRQLFWDPRLSVSNAVACVSCHHPDLGWTDGKSVSQGHQLTRTSRNSPTLMGVAFSTKFMWDGRASSLESQVLLPLANAGEMHAEFSDVEKRINAVPGYREQFKAVFGEERVTLDHITKAIATFERTIVPGRSRFDSFIKGRSEALNDQELRGLHLYRTAARCINCHTGPLMTDQKFHNIGLSAFGREREDLGRYKITNDPKDVGAFKTPTLRNITRTGPYMHNGLFELPGILNIYDNGGVQPKPRASEIDNPLFPKASPILRQLMLTDADKLDILAFLASLEEPRLRINPPELPAD